MGSLTVADDPRHSTPGENRFKQDQEVKRSARKARKIGIVEATSNRQASVDAKSDAALKDSYAGSAPITASAQAPVALKPHKLSDVIGALWPQWVGQFGLVTGPSSMGVVDANAADLALVRALWIGSFPELSCVAAFYTCRCSAFAICMWSLKMLTGAVAR